MARKRPTSPCPARRRRPPKCRRNQDGGFQRRGQCKRNRPFSAGRGVRSMPSTSHRAAPSCRALTAKPFFSPKRLTFPQAAAIHRQRHQAVFRSPDSGSAPPVPGTPAPCNPVRSPYEPPPCGSASPRLSEPHGAGGTMANARRTFKRPCPASSTWACPERAAAFLPGRRKSLFPAMPVLRNHS